MKKVVVPKTDAAVRDKRTKKELVRALDAVRRDDDELFDRLQKLNVQLEEVRQDLYAKQGRIFELEQDRSALMNALEHMVASALATMSPLTFWQTLRTNAKLLKLSLGGAAAQRIENACRDVAPHIVTACCRMDEEIERMLSRSDDE